MAKAKRLAKAKTKVYDNPDETTLILGPSSETAPSQGKPSKKTALDKEPTTKESAEFAAFLGDVEKLSITESGRNNTIFIDGVKSTHESDPAVKRCPLHFRWRKKANSVKDGNSFTNGGYVVLSKKIMGQATFKLTVSRDDTPNEDFYTVGELVLCCTNKVNFQTRKLEAVLKSIKRPQEVKKQRNEFAKQQAKNTDVVAVTENYANVNTGDSKTMPSKFKAPEDYGEMIKQAQDEAAVSDISAV